MTAFLILFVAGVSFFGGLCIGMLLATPRRR
jgi:hypothetical protein